jgi:hypothetical protein
MAAWSLLSSQEIIEKGLPSQRMKIEIEMKKEIAASG